ncbi:MAG TPA: magnesium transporter CorA family protein [Chthoniobacterales bacterium]|nr:magnesium transporter CorA family protein [Chthoniobacterales bacterium]
MITFHAAGEKGTECRELARSHALIQKAAWIDVFEPSEQEEIILDMAFSIDLPTRREMQDIEVSRRLYREGNAVFMTVTIPRKADTNEPESTTVTFIFVENRLITLRYADSAVFRLFRQERESDLARYDSGQRMLEGLVETLIEYIADALENAGVVLDGISREIFRRRKREKTGAPATDGGGDKSPDLEEALLRLGRCSDLLSQLRESLGGLRRMLSFFTAARVELSPGVSERLRGLSNDLQPLADHASFLSQKLNFLLDATLGLINVEQNAIIKIFTVAAVLFLPPTVVGTIYGMNFKFMPELEWYFGYPLAIFLMIGSAILPYYYFKRRRWF